MRFAWKFPNFFNIVSIETVFHNCFPVKIVKINSIGGAIVLFAAYSVYGGISFAFSHLISHPSSTLSSSNFGGYEYFTYISYVPPSFCLLLIQLMDTFLCVFSLRFSYLIHCLHQKFISQPLFGKQSNSKQFATWRHRSLLLMQFMHVFSMVFFHRFSFFFQGLLHQFFGL